jgi:uncharacterized protein
VPLTSVTTPAQKQGLTRRRFLTLGAASGAGLLLYSGEFERHRLQIVQQTIYLPRLPQEFRGYRIAQISDIHFAEFTEAWFLKDVVRHINALDPDLVVLTGDYVSEGPLPKREAIRFGYSCAEHLSKLQCPLRFAVLGNHDCIVGTSAVMDALTTHGLPVLANRSIPIEKDGKRIWLAGVKDALLQAPDFDAALKNPSQENEAVILLGHEPDAADFVAPRRVDLMLSGHTHGGQVRVPFVRPVHLPMLGVKYLEGLFRVGAMQLYVNRGIGTVGVPFRFRCPPELTLITLS